MLKSLVTKADRWRFERPLAVALVLATIFLGMAVPAERLTMLPGLLTYPLFQPVLAVLAGAVLGAIGYGAMSYPWSRRVLWSRSPAETDALEDDDADRFAPGEVALRLRRADRHPDAPARAPIFASRDLGSPFMDVGTDVAPAIPDGDYSEVAADPAPDAPQPDPADHAAPDPVVEDDPAHAVDDDAGDRSEPATDQAWPLPRVAPDPVPEPQPDHAPIAAFAPDDQPAAARTQRASLEAMMERLSTGLERRATPSSSPNQPLPFARPRASQPALREALDELNRLAARRG